MGTDFKFLGAISSILIGSVFLAGTILNFINGNQSSINITATIALFFFVLAYLSYQRAMKVKKEEQAKLAQEKNAVQQVVQLPTKQYRLDAMQEEAAKVSKTIHLAIDQADEGEIAAARVLIKQAKSLMELWKPSNLSEENYEAMWVRDLEAIETYLSVLES